jgi:hypothetical protein
MTPWVGVWIGRGIPALSCFQSSRMHGRRLNCHSPLDACRGMQAFMEVSDSPFKEAAVGGGLDPQEPMAVAVAVHPDMRNGDMASMTNRREAAGDDEEGRGQEQGYAASGSPSQPSVMDQEEEEEGRGTATAPDDFRRTASNEFRSSFAPSCPAKGICVA